MYYLFKQGKELDQYKLEFERVSNSINKGITPVYCEMRSARCSLIESFPLNIISGLLLIVGTILLDKLFINETIKIAIVLIVNSLCGAIANYLFVVIKHWLRLRLCKRMGIYPTEHNIAVMESLEYQSV